MTMVNHIFAAQTKQGTLRIYEVSFGATEKLPELEAIFNELFPQYQQYISRIRAIARGDRGELIDKVPHQWLLEIDDRPAGLINFTFSTLANCGLGHNLAIFPEYRDFSFGSFSRLSEVVIYLAMQQLISDSSGRTTEEPAGLLVEVEMAATTSNPAEQRRRENLFRRYEAYGLIEVPVCYYEPPGLIRDGQKQDDVTWERLDFHPMRLGIFPHWPKAKILTPESKKNLLTAFLCHHYGLERTHWAVAEGFTSIPANPDTEPATITIASEPQMASVMLE